MNCKNQYKDKSSTRIVIPITEEQHEQLRKAAYASAYKTVSAYCRMLLFDKNNDLRKDV